MLLALAARHAQDAPIPRPDPAARSLLAVLVPIAAGLLLTAIAAYKHRGLPGGK